MNWNNRELTERRDGPSSLDINTERWHEFREKCVSGQVFEKGRSTKTMFQIRFARECANTGLLVCIDQPENLHISTMQDDFNADHLELIAAIVVAVNSHDKLVSACRAAAEHFRDTDAPIGKMCREALEACK